MNKTHACMKHQHHNARLFSQIVSASVGIIFLLQSIAHADWTLVNSDFSTQSGLTVNTWDTGEGLSVTTDSGKLVKVDTRSVVSLTANRPSQSGAETTTGWRLSLRNGDVLNGEVAGISGQSLQFRTTEMGTILVPLKIIATLTASHQDHATSPFSATPAADKDVVYMQNGDSLGGFIVSLDQDKLQLSTSSTDNSTTDIQMRLVQRVYFSGITTPRTVPTLAARVTFVSGSVLTVPLTGDDSQKGLAWSINDVTLKDPGGQDHKISADRISEIEILGGRVVYLSELDPTHEEQVSFMGTPWPMRVNENVMEQPLKVAKTNYPRGLGVHTRSLLSYDLGGNFATLKLRVGMDDSAAPRGEADLSIIGDGKILWQSKNIKAGQISPELALPITGVKLLELHADPSATGNTGGAQMIDVLGRVDWLNVALIRP